MVQDRPRPDSDRLVIARLDGVTQRHARRHEPTEAETAPAVAELREIVAHRDDGPALLAEAAGILTGFHEGGLNEPQARAGAHFRLEAGADVDLVAQREEEGRRRRDLAGQPPFRHRSAGAPVNTKRRPPGVHVARCDLPTRCLRIV